MEDLTRCFSYNDNTMIADAVASTEDRASICIVLTPSPAPGGEPTKVKCNYIWANVITFAQM